ncbi:hypothetical protein C4D60_Mb01t21830 [Musa balbisiana]|uniref:Uncharacterized protein n=1 Tax=Musa balbisiana TaxID=52838 RepID=A0A4S8JP65_MUSBA|nr:hypothetical protein C4D60_Mb01t21830 [Musa balbisiana]
MPMFVPVQGDPENLRLGLERRLLGELGNHPLGTTGVVSLRITFFASGFINGPCFISSGSGFSDYLSDENHMKEK